MDKDEFKDLCMCGETTRVQFKREFTSQKEIAKEMIAFANSHGGIILFGVGDKTGELLGLSYEQIQQISRELANTAQEQVKPTIYVETEVVKVDDKHFLVCTVIEGKNKPYKNLQGEIWVKQGADKRRITENVEILSLFQSSSAYRPEEEAIKGTSISDLEISYLRDYFRKVYNREIEEFEQPLESMLRSLRVLSSSGEVTRAGMLFFGKNPTKYELSYVVKAVAFNGNSIGDTSYFDSRDISGTIPWMFRETMSFLKSVLRHEQNGQNFNKVGILEVPEVVLEELLQNAFVHIDLLHAAAIRVLVFNDRIEIINPGSLFGGLQIADIKLGVSRQRNPLIASFASKTMIYRGLGSGIIRVMNENIKVDFINEESANQFKTIIWRTIQNNVNDASKDVCNESNNASYGINDASKVVSDASTEYNIASKDASNIVRLSKDELYDKIMDVCVDYISLDDIAKAVNKTLRYLKSKIIPRMVEQGLLERKYPDTPRHPKQQYRKK
jgi:predicted HTH transcriptional regulator